MLRTNMDCPGSRGCEGWDNLEATRLVRVYSNRIAAFIIEPVAGNMGVVPPAAGYLAGLRKLCDEHGRC